MPSQVILTLFYTGYIIPTMKANLILHTKEILGDEVVEIKIWKVPLSADKDWDED